MKAFKGGYSLTSCKKNVWIQLHYRAALLEENTATKLLVSCFLPFKAICLLSKSRTPQPQLSQSLYVSEHGDGTDLGNVCTIVSPHQEWEPRAGR